MTISAPAPPGRLWIRSTGWLGPALVAITAAGVFFGPDADRYWGALVAAAAAVAIVVVTLSEPRAALYLFVAAYPIGSFTLGQLGGNLSITNVLLLLAGGAVFAQWATGRQPALDLPWAPRIAVVVLVPALMIATIPAIVLSPEMAQSLHFIPLRIGYGLALCLTVWLIDRPDRLALVLRLFVWTSIVASVGLVAVAFFPEWVAALPLPKSLQYTGEISKVINLLGTGSKTVLFFDSFQGFASWTAFALPIAIGLVIWPASFRGHRITGWLGVVTIGSGMLLSMTRAAWIAGALAIGLWALLLPTLGASRRWRIAATVVVVMLAVGVMLFFGELALVSEWALTAQQGTVNERLAVYRVSLDAWSRDPWFGVGPYVIENALAQQGYHGIIHNSILLELVYVGIVGALPYILLLGLSVWTVLRSLILVRDSVLRPLVAGVAISFAASLEVFQTYGGLGEKSLWVMMGLVLALPRALRVAGQPEGVAGS